MSQIVRLRAEHDPNYRPYCLPCPGLVRMVIVEQFFWRCVLCGAEHDERVIAPRAGTPPTEEK